MQNFLFVVGVWRSVFYRPRGHRLSPPSRKWAWLHGGVWALHLLISTICPLHINNLWPLFLPHLAASDSHKKSTQEGKADLRFLHRETECPLGWCKHQRKHWAVMGEAENPWILQHENFKRALANKSRTQWGRTEMEEDGSAREEWGQHAKWRRRWRRSWLCLFGNSRWRSPRGMLMRDRPFRGVGGWWCLLTDSRPHRGRGEPQGSGKWT